MEESLLDQGERKRFFVPLPYIQTYRTATTTGYQSPDAPIWIDASPDGCRTTNAKGLICDTTASTDNPRTLTISDTLLRVQGYSLTSCDPKGE